MPATNHRSETNLWTVAEVAAYFQVSQPTVYRWIKTEILPIIRLGTRTTRIRSEDLDAFVQIHLTYGSHTAASEERSI